MRNTRERDTGKQSVWATYLTRIDGQIEQFAAQAGTEPIDNFEQLEQHLRAWLDNQELDDRDRAEWDRLKANSRMLQARIKQRYNELVKRGRIKAGRWSSFGRHG